MGDREIMLKVDDKGWVQVPGYVQIRPALPGDGRVLGVKSVAGVVHVMQQSEAGPRLYRLNIGSDDSPSSWEEVRPAPE